MGRICPGQTHSESGLGRLMRGEDGSSRAAMVGTGCPARTRGCGWFASSTPAPVPRLPAADPPVLTLTLPVRTAYRPDQAKQRTPTLRDADRARWLRFTAVTPRSARTRAPDLLHLPQCESRKCAHTTPTGQFAQPNTARGHEQQAPRTARRARSLRTTWFAAPRTSAPAMTGRSTLGNAGGSLPVDVG